MSRPILSLLSAASVSLGVPAFSADLDFYRDVYPVLRANCISCHNKTTTKGDLNMESPEALREGGESGAGVTAGKGAESLVLQAAAHQADMVMPPKGNKTGAKRLTPPELALLQAWIDQGAKDSIKQVRQIGWQPLPPGVNPIYTVAMTPDGRFAACGRANQIFIYDLATRQIVTHLPAHRSMVESLAFSPDGTRLASGSFREVKIWRQEKEVALVRKADPALHSILSALTLDGKQLVCADANGLIRILDATSGAVLKTLPGLPPATPALLSLSPDSSKLALYSSDSTLALWDLQAGRSLSTKSDLAGMRALAWTSDSAAVVSAGSDKTLRVYSWPSADQQELAPKELKSVGGPITALAPGSDPDRLFAASEDGKVRAWSLSKGTVLTEFPVAAPLALSLSPDGQNLAIGCADGAIRIFGTGSGKLVIELRGDVDSERKLGSLNRVVAAQGLELAFQKQELARIEAENKALEELYKKALETTAGVKKLLPEKEKAVVVAKEATLTAQKAVDEIAALIAKAPEGKPDAALEKQSKEANDKLMAATTAESAAIAAVASSQNHLQDAEEQAKRITLAKEKNGVAIAAVNAASAAAKETQSQATTALAAMKSASVTGAARPAVVAFSCDGQSVASAFNDSSYHFWGVPSGMPIDSPKLQGAAASALVADRNGEFIFCRPDGEIDRVNNRSNWIVDRVLGGEAKAPTAPLFADRVNALRFSPDGQTLAVGGGEPSRSGDISLWQVSDGKLLKSWNERHSDSVLSLDFSPDGKLLASGGADRIARVTTISNGKQLYLLEGHTHHVMGVTFRADGRVLASAGADGVVLVWDMLSGERKKKIEGWTKEVTSLQFIGASNQILTSAGDNRLRIVSDEGAEIRAIAKLPNFMQSAATAGAGSVIIGGGEDSLLRVWDGSDGRELAAFDPKNPK